MKTFKHPRYTYLKDNTYYFTRAIPHDLRQYYTRPRIVQSLRTKSVVQAKLASNSLSSKLDDYWLRLRLKEADVPGTGLLITPGHESNLPTIEECLEQYLRIKGKNKSESFFQGARRNINYLTNILGIRPLDQYSSADAAKLREQLLAKGLSPTSLLRIFGGIKAVTNFVILENGFECHNPFTGVYIPTSEARRRHPIPDKEIISLQTECMAIDDDIRWLVSLISDTGMRLSEATGLLKEDIYLDDGIPYVHVQPHPHRRLKTESSTRKIPLVGGSLWAASRVVNQPTAFCFPRYTNEQTCNSNSASAAINKWIKTVVNKDAVVHGLRHSFRDRLRAVETPPEMIDQLGGWSSKSVGQSYGEGYKLDVTQSWLTKMVLLGL